MKYKLWLTAVVMLLFCTIFAVVTSAAETVTVTTVAALQSPHPYTSNMDKTWVYTHSTNTTGLKVTFSSDTAIENGYDYIYICDGNDTQIGKYTGTSLAGVTVEIPGKTVKIRLTSDSSVTNNGFTVTAITTSGTETHSHPICGNSCNCIFASHTSSQTWKAWDGSTKMTSGYYYLTKDVELSETMILNYSYTAYLCLNGHTISCADDVVFDIYSYYSLNICDCKGGGAVKSTDGFAVIQNNNKLTVFSGTIIGENSTPAIYNYDGKYVTVHNGEITSSGSSAIYSMGNVTVYGGKISGKWDSIDMQQGNLQIHGGEFSGIVANYFSDQSTVITGGIFNDNYNGYANCLHCDGKTTISGGTFNGTCSFGGTTSISGGSFNGEYIWSLNIGSKMYLSGNPTIKKLLINYPDTVSAKSADGTSYYSGGEIIVEGNGSDLKNGDIAISDVTPANSYKFVGNPEICELTLSGTDLIYRYIRCEKNGHYFSTNSSTCMYCGAVGGKCGQYVYWGLDAEGTLVIHGSGKMYDYPSYSTPSPWYNKTVNRLIILDGVTSIGNYAFNNCDKLTSIDFKTGTISSIGDYAFGDCDKLISIDFGESTIEVGNKAFAWCDSLKEITVPSNVSNTRHEMFLECANLESAVISCNTVSQWMFDGCPRLSNVILTEGVETIKRGAFAHNSSLTAIQFPETLQSVEDYLFSFAYGSNSLSLERVVFLSADTDIATCLVFSKANNFTVYAPACSIAAKYAQTYNNPFSSTDSSTHQAAYVADCTVDSSCAKCGYVLSKGNEKHTFTTYISNNDATCSEDGTKTSYCSYCDVLDTITDEGSKQPHTAGEWITDSLGNDLSEGSRHKECIYCEMLLENEATPATKLLLLPSASYSKTNNGLLINVAEKTSGTHLLSQFGNTVGEMKIFTMDGEEISDISETIGTGSTVRLITDDMLIDTLTVIVCGDVNGDAVSDTNDLDILKYHYAGWSNYAEQILYPESADINGDGIMTRSDVMLLARRLTGWNK